MVDEAQVGGCRDRRIARVVVLVIKDLSKRWTLAEAAAVAGLRPAYFSRRFYQTMSIGFVEWSARARVEEAKVLLRMIDLSITGVAASVGYDDLTTFDRVFRKYEHTCPGQYRRGLLFRAGQGAPKTRQETPRPIVETHGLLTSEVVVDLFGVEDR